MWVAFVLCVGNESVFLFSFRKIGPVCVATVRFRCGLIVSVIMWSGLRVVMTWCVNVASSASWSGLVWSVKSGLSSGLVSILSSLSVWPVIWSGLFCHLIYQCGLSSDLFCHLILSDLFCHLACHLSSGLSPALIYPHR